MASTGILTRHCYPNYGSFLQTHAMVEALRAEGGEATVIDYVPRDDTPRGLVRSSLRESRMNTNPGRRMVFRAVQGPNLYRMAKRFRAHQKQGLPLSAEAGNRDGVRTAATAFDQVVVGSDQVWNTIHGAVDPTYYLDDVHARRYSYAASFGSGTLPSGEETRIQRWLGDFAVVSVRERSAQQALAAVGIESRLDVDPVLLHGRQFWSDFAGAPVREPASYVLAYQLHNTADFQETLNLVGSRTGLPVRRVTADAKQFARYRASDYLADPATFVRLIRDAAVVVTDSFHGTAFSLLLGRPIHAVLPARNRARIEDLLSTVSLEEKTGPASSVTPDYDDGVVSEAIESLRAESRVYIRHLARTSP